MSAGVAELADATGTGPTPAAGATARATERAICWLLAGLAALVASGPITDNSLLTHIATGRLQVNGGLPRENPFLNTSSDFPVPSWWWSAALGWAERTVGLTGIRILTVAVAAVLGWLIVRAARPVNDPHSPARTVLGQLLPGVVVLVLLIPFLNGRPHLPGFVLLAATLIVWRERRSPWWLVPLFALWVNVHGTWLYGLMVLGLCWVAEAVDDRRLHLERLRWAAAIAGGLLVGGIWYPERFRLVLLPTEQLGSAEAREAMRLYAEWHPVRPGSPLMWVFSVVVVLAAYGVWKRRLPGLAVTVVILAIMGASAQRMLPVAAITLAAVAALGVVAASSMALPGPRVRAVMAGLGVAALATSVAVAVVSTPENLEKYPRDEVAWMAERGLVANPDVTVVHNDFVGNYLEYVYGDRAEAWVDDRPSVETLLDYSKLRKMTEGWETALQRADPDVVLWQTKDDLPGELARRGEWTAALTTDDFQLLCHARIADRCR